MKKLLLLVMALFIFCVPSSSAKAEDLPASVRVITVSTRIYNSASLSDPMLNGEEEVRAVHGDTFEVLSLVVSENSFYEISYAGESAYILKAHVLDTNIDANNVKLDTNAVLRENAEVFEYANQTYSKVDITLEKGTRVKLLDGIDNSLEYTRISFEIGEETLTYYVPTTAISPDGMSAGGITAIALIITCTSLLLILFGCKGKKKKKKEK